MMLWQQLAVRIALGVDAAEKTSQPIGRDWRILPAYGGVNDSSSLVGQCWWTVSTRTRRSLQMAGRFCLKVGFVVMRLVILV